MKARTISARRRVVIALLTFAVSVSGIGTAMADDPTAVDPQKTLIDTILPITNVVATGINPTQIFVAWNSSSPLATQFRIEEAFDQFGPWVPVQLVNGCNAALGTSLCTTAYITGPASDPTPRWIRVTAIFAITGTNNPGVDGTVILEGNPSDPDPAILAPPPPTNLKCNGGGPSSTSCFNVADVELTWQDNSDEAEFWIMRAPNSAQPCRAKPWGNTPHATVPADTTVYEEHIAIFNAIFYYKVVAVRVVPIVKTVDGAPRVVTERAYSDTVNPDCIKVLTPPKAPPTAPSGLTGTFIPPNTVHLAWTDIEPNPLSTYVEEDGFFIEFGGNSSAYEVLTSTPANPGQGTVTYDDRLPADTTRCYRVRSYRNGPAYSQFSNSVCIGAIPRAPSGLNATAISNARVDLTWTDNSNTESEFVIERCHGVCTSGSTWTSYDTAPADATTYSDISTVALTTYSYRVRARNATGSSAPSNIDSATTLAASVAKPTLLTAVAMGAHSIRLDWNDNSSDETGFRIEYKDPYGDWGLLVNVGANVTTYLDENSLSANQTRFYRVRARKGTAVSDPSNIASATTFSAAAPNGVPWNFRGVEHDNVSVDLDWEASTITNEDYFQIEYIGQPDKSCAQAVQLDDTTPRTAFKGKVKVGRNATSTRVTGLVPHTAYWFRIFAVNQDGESGPGTLQSDASKHTLGCILTKGPALPVFKDPGVDGDVKATRCDVTLNMPTTGALAVTKVRLIVNAVVSGSIASTKIIEKDASIATPSGDWVIGYKFRQGISYRLIATAYGASPTFYHSADATRYDVKVLADCPIEPDPVE